MKSEIVVINQVEAPEPIKVRRIRWDAGKSAFPRCSWCKIQELRMLVEVVQHGFTVDLIQAVCYCDSCNLGTIVEFEAFAITGEVENQKEYNNL